MPRPRIALITTAYYPKSHGDVIGTRLIAGYEFSGAAEAARVEVASLYVDQLGQVDAGVPLAGLGVEVSDRAGVPRFPTVGEALGCGRPGVNVDGVVIIGEHGSYERNEFGQKLYPRRRLYDAAVAAMVSGGRTVPVFCDKHLAWAFQDASEMYQTARRLEVPLLAGSSVPLAWRVPTAAQWPAGAPMGSIVAVAYGDTEANGFHALEAIQVLAERRRGGETGVVSVCGLRDAAANEAVESGAVEADLLGTALAALGLPSQGAMAVDMRPKDVFLVHYSDGLRAAIVIYEEEAGTGFSVACRGPETRLACQFWLDKEKHRHFTFLVRQIEALVLNGVPPYPVERTLLTGGILDAAMRSRCSGGKWYPTPELAIAYQAPSEVADTAVPLSKGEVAYGSAA